MNAAATILAVLAALGQLTNIYLHLRIANAILESERRILDRIQSEYPAQAVCDARMEAIERRLELLEV